MDNIRAILIAGAGGFLLNLMPLWEDTRKLKSDRAPRDGLFWLFLVIWPLIGAGLAYLYILEGSTLKPLLALTVGLGAPATIRSAMSTAAQPSHPPEGAEP